MHVDPPLGTARTCITNARPSGTIEFGWCRLSTSAPWLLVGLTTSSGGS